LKRPVGVSVGVLLIVLFGLLALYAIPVQLTPNIDVPIINVQTRWAGANPQEIEKQIVDRQEEVLRSVKGLRKMTSQSRDNRARIALEFYPGADKDAAMRDVTDKLRQVSNYPLEVDEPTVEAADSGEDSPIAWIQVYSDDPEVDANIQSYRDFAEDHIKPYFDRVPGVASVDVYGGRRREVQVRVNAGELAARQLTFGQVVSALRSQNANIAAGTRTQGKRDFTVRTVGQYASTDEVLNTVVAYTDGGPVYIRDVAQAEIAFAEQTSMVRSRGRSVMSMPIRREVGTNVIEVMDGVKQAIKRVQSEVLDARGMKLKLRQVYDETVYIKQSIAMVQTNIVFGGFFAIIVLMFFLRNWRATLVVALAIPIAVIGTFVVMAAFGRSLNVISLAGMAFAVGMVVDNAIVVLENIYRHRQMGKPVMDAALDGAREVWGAVLASTLTTMAVFIPVIFVREEAGQLFRDISIATATAVGLSLIVSVTVIPTLAARLLSSRRRQRGLEDSESTGGRAAGVAAWVVGRLNEKPLARLAVILLMTGGSLVLARALVPDSTYLPAGNRNLIFGFLATPPGYSLDEFREMARQIEEVVSPYWSCEPGSDEKKKLDEAWVARVKEKLARGEIRELAEADKKGLSELQKSRIRREWLTPPPCIDNFFFVSFNGGSFVGASSVDWKRVKALKNLFEYAGEQIPGVYAHFAQSSLFRFGGGNSAEVQLRGDNLEDVTAAAGAMFQKCQALFGHPRTSPSNFNLGRPELQIIPDRERAADMGLNVGDVGLIVEACVDGAYVGDFREAGGETIDIALYVAGQHDKPTQDIGNVPIYTPAGSVVPLASAVNMIDTSALEQINHIERQRSVSITVSPPEAMALDAVIREIRDRIEPELRESGQIDDDVLVALTGNANKLVTARNTMIGEWKGWKLESLVNIAGSRFFLSVLIVYLLMAALYESWLYPLVIMFSVPLAIFGGFLGLWLANKGTLLSDLQPVQQLDVLTFLGFVILVGVVVNNAILLVNQSLHNMREGGLSPHTAIREAVRIRVRPVLMTSLTTFFGQLPLALFPGAGSELYRGLASVMLGGLIVATIGTLILVPAVLGLVVDLRGRVVRSTGRGAAVAAMPRDR